MTSGDTLPLPTELERIAGTLELDFWRSGHDSHATSLAL